MHAAYLNSSDMKEQTYTHPVQWAEIHPDKIALLMVESQEKLTYGQLVKRSSKLATYFKSQDLRPGDTIAILMENNIYYPEVVWAAKNTGLRYVAISSHLNVSDAKFIFNDSGASLLIYSPKLSNIVSKMSLGEESISLCIGTAEYENYLQRAKSLSLEGQCRGASMLYSSGTTGRPKGIRTRVTDVSPLVPPPRFALLRKQFNLGSDVTFINPAPFYHAGPLRFMMSVHRSGGTVIGFEKFDPLKVIEAVNTYDVTHGFFVPTMFTRMLDLPENQKSKLSRKSLRHIVHAAAPCPPRVKYKMIEWWGPVIDELYSGTESIGHTFITSKEWLAHPGSVGKAASNCKIRIVNDEGTEIPVGQTGRIEMYNGFRVSYHGRASEDSVHDSDGYASFGDVGYLDDEGYLYITDRDSDMILVGGVNIYPREAELVLMSHPKVIDVAVFGVPDDDLGESIKGLVVLKDDDSVTLQQELKDFCYRSLSRIKCPHSIDFVEKLPRNELGKLDKKSLRQSYWAGVGRHI